MLGGNAVSDSSSVESITWTEESVDLAGDSSEHTAGVVGEADVVENEGLVPPATKAGLGDKNVTDGNAGHKRPASQVLGPC